MSADYQEIELFCESLLGLEPQREFGLLEANYPDDWGLFDYDFDEHIAFGDSKEEAVRESIACYERQIEFIAVKIKALRAMLAADEQQKSKEK